MAKEYDWDTYEILKEQLISQLPCIESNILNLDKSEFVKDAIDELFQTFSSYRTTSHYLNLTPLYELTSKVEIVLASLRDDIKIVQESIIEWFLEVKDQLNIWIEDMEDVKLELSPVSKRLKEKVKLTKSYIPLKEILANLNILYLDNNNDRANKVSIFLNKIVHNSTSTSDTLKFEDFIKEIKYDILILNLDKKNYQLVEKARKVNQNIPIIAIFDTIDEDVQKELIRNNIDNTTTNPLDANKLKSTLKFLTKHHFVSRNVIVDNKKIANFLKTLEPLSNTIMQIMQICDDDEIPIKELIRVVKTDSIITAVILKSANSPLYGSIELKTIDQAVTRLGKTAIKALVASDIYKNIGKVDLTPYGINEDIFSQVSIDRLTLVTKWYCKVCIGDLAVLSCTAVLGNIGQLLIAKELIEMDLVDNFKNIYASIGIKHAEGKTLHTSTTTITAQILNYWNLSFDIIDTIAYSQNPSEAPQELQHLVIANNIVYDLVRLDGSIVKEIPDDILVLMAKYNLDVQPLQNALTYLLDNKELI